MLEPDEVAAVDARIEVMARAAVAGGLRLQAMSLRSCGELLTAQARTLDDQADAIEAGDLDPPEMPVRLQVVPVDDVAKQQPEPGAVEQVEESTFGSSQILVPADGGEFSKEMAGFLGMFDDRLRMSPHFPTAINEAAAAGHRISEHTAGLVRDRVYELRDAAASATGGDRGAT